MHLNKSEYDFSRAFASCFAKRAVLAAREHEGEALAVQKLKSAEEELSLELDLRRLFELLQMFCESSPRPVVLMIDEADSASDNQVFLDFPAQLRSYYLERESAGTVTFQSVILAGVYDIRNVTPLLQMQKI